MENDWIYIRKYKRLIDEPKVLAELENFDENRATNILRLKDFFHRIFSLPRFQQNNIRRSIHQ